MKKLLPFIFPVTALLVVVFLTYRWYNQNTQRDGQISEFAEGVEIEELSDSERDSVVRGTGDFESVALENQSDTESLGEVRYEMADGKVRFSVTADLPESTEGQYQVWLKATDSDAIRKAFRLVASKGGYTGSAAISTETLPFEVVVSKEMTDDETLEEVMLRGTVAAEEEVEAAE